MFSGTDVPPGKHEDGAAVPLATPFLFSQKCTLNTRDEKPRIERV
jgi:hypothetical protein